MSKSKRKPQRVKATPQDLKAPEYGKPLPASELFKDGPVDIVMIPNFNRPDSAMQLEGVGFSASQSQEERQVIMDLIIRAQNSVRDEERAQGFTAGKAAGLAETIEASNRASDREIPVTELQAKIWDILEGKALTADALEGKLEIDRKQLYRDGINPLKGSGRIKNDRKLGGYYRPDAPPRYPTITPRLRRN